MAPVLRTGILGATTTVEQTLLPALISLHTHFDLKIIYDQAQETAEHCQKKFNIPQSTISPVNVLRHPEVDLVLNLLPFEYHEQYTIAALEAGKHVMVEVPLSLSIQGLRRIRAAMKKGTATCSNGTGPKVFVGCVRRFAPCFEDIFKKELASLGRVYYARCRNITGPLSIDSNDAYDASDEVNNAIRSPKIFHALLADVFGSEEDITTDRIAFCRFLGNIGCHDLALLRESLGFPDAVANIAITEPFYSAIFHYSDGKEGHPFTLLYEAGCDAVPRCDAHLTVYGSKKTVSLKYDFPCPSQTGCQDACVRVIVEEVETGRDGSHINSNGDGNGVVPPHINRTETVSSCAESYEREFLALHSYLVGDTRDSTTTDENALMDLRLLQRIFAHYDRQCGTIRTPLG
ncbi:hypothetical protein N7495_004456 [Penicillium taxi]|uniref:uncharacterized protein n=1 Tax=Penicillium taxi TaxID=168475 RepID=UPI00254585AA|nr:uncharacterized protein N7495_004456 [Penicillium taxi]KAJ5899712.1 hypothetical protein N7495_004456 [Penicillium taxi]